VKRLLWVALVVIALVLGVISCTPPPAPPTPTPSPTPSPTKPPSTPPARTTLTLAVNGNGTTTPSSGARAYDAGTVVNITATATSGWKFDGWSGDVAAPTSATTTVTMNSDKTVVANFQKLPTPLNVKIDYFGITNPHQQGTSLAPNKIRLFAVVDDGIKTQSFSYPSGTDGLPIKDPFYLEDLGGQKVFSTSSVGDHLRLSVLAYSCPDIEAMHQILDMLKAYDPAASTLKQLYDGLTPKKDLIGWYEHTWDSTEKYGAASGKYEAVGSGDLKLWFRIWSDNEPQVIAKPPFNPEVRIQSVKLGGADPPWQVKRNQGIFQEFPYPNYSVLITVVNNESVDLAVDWAGLSDTKEGFGSGRITVPKNSSKTGTATVHFNSSGQFKITYSVSRGGVVLDTWSGMVNVIPLFIKLPSIFVPSFSGCVIV